MSTNIFVDSRDGFLASRNHDTPLHGHKRHPPLFSCSFPAQFSFAVERAAQENRQRQCGTLFFFSITIHRDAEPLQMEPTCASLPACAHVAPTTPQPPSFGPSFFDVARQDTTSPHKPRSSLDQIPRFFSSPLSSSEIEKCSIYARAVVGEARVILNSRPLIRFPLDKTTIWQPSEPRHTLLEASCCRIQSSLHSQRYIFAQGLKAVFEVFAYFGPIFAHSSALFACAEHTYIWNARRILDVAASNQRQYRP